MENNLPKKILVIVSIFMMTALNSCNGFFKYSPARDNPTKGTDRAKKNVEEGRGVNLGGLVRGSRGTNYEFSTSNPLWRATLDVLDFLPLSTVDYSGGVIITDWYSGENNSNERCKLNIFITGNELKTQNLKVTSFCQIYENLKWVDKKTDIENNIKIENAILNKAKKLKLQSS